jgi:hypothetical protein
MTNVLNAKITAAAKAAAKLDDAKVTLRDTAADLLAADVTPARISRDGDLLAQFQEVTAAAIFTKPDLAMWADTSLAISTSEKVNGKRKQTNTPRGLLVNRVNSVIRNIRKAMEEVTADPKARGPKEKSTPTQAFFKAIDGYVERFAKDDASDTFDFDCVTARAALGRDARQASLIGWGGASRPRFPRPAAARRAGFFHVQRRDAARRGRARFVSPSGETSYSQQHGA